MLGGEIGFRVDRKIIGERRHRGKVTGTWIRGRRCSLTCGRGVQELFDAAHGTGRFGWCSLPCASREPRPLCSLDQIGDGDLLAGRVHGSE